MSNNAFDVVKTAVIGLLLAGNIFFMKKFIDKTEAYYDMTRDVRQEVAVLKVMFETYTRQKR